MHLINKNEKIMRKLRNHLLSFLVLTFCSFGVLSAQNAMYISVTGSQQGKIQGGNMEKGKEGLSSVVSYEHEVVAPRDAASGLPTGKRQHSPLKITKEVDKATPKLYAAFSNNESLPEVTLSFYRSGGKGVPGLGASQKWYQIKLTNATVSGIKSGVNEKGVPVEEVSFSYQQIEWEYTDGGITHQDNWVTTRN